MSDWPQVFGGYVLLKLLGSGVSGDVFLAKPKEPRPGVPSPVVIKRLHHELADDRAFALRFKQEAQIALAVDNPHVARVYDVGRVGETYYMAIEYIAGWTLSRVVHDLRESGSFASFSSIRDIVGDALEGLHALHTATDPATRIPLQVVHRDIAPKNLILGEDSVTRLIDLGIGKSAYQDWRTNTGVVVGSPGYMSPEQARGGDVDQRTDIYGMGLILWELLTSRAFIERAPLPVMLRAQAEPNYRAASSLRADVPKVLDELTAVALARDPKDRFQNAKEMQAALYSAIGARVEGQVSSTIVGALLWGELGDSKTEITQLLSDAVVEVPIEKDSNDTLVLPVRDDELEASSDPTPLSTPPLIGWRDPASAPPGMLAPGMAWQDPASGLPGMLPPPASQDPFVQLQINTGSRLQLPWTWVLGLMFLALAVGILFSARFFAGQRQPAPEDPPPQQVVEIPPAARPSIEARVVEQPPPVVVDPPQETSKEIEKPRSKKKSRRRAAENKAEETVGALIARARAVQQSAGEGSERAKTAARIISDLNLEAARQEIDRGTLRKIEDRLQSIE